MNLVRAEISRLTTRRFVQLMVVLLLGAFVVTAATTVVTSHRPSPSEIAFAEKEAEHVRSEMTRAYPKCRAELDSSRYPGNPLDCEALHPARVDPANFLHEVFIFKRDIKALMYLLVAFLALFGFLVGASYIGADLNSGGLTNLLLWRPQRMQVLGAKLGTLLGGVLVVLVVASALYLGMFWAIAKFGGLTGNLDGEFWRWLGLFSARGGLLVLGVTALGFAIAMLGRHTAAALGVVAAYAIVWEAGARIVMEVVDAAHPEQWMLSTYLAAWMTGSVNLWGSIECDTGFCSSMQTLTWRHAAAVFGVLFVGSVVAAFANFRRRDLA
ncbi:MAG TPA: ABC transporter permease [Micromonosporaceae bacterium]|nr:ABC transporter permease [Micromonosporaceae bacterium]